VQTWAQMQALAAKCQLSYQHLVKKKSQPQTLTSKSPKLSQQLPLWVVAVDNVDP
jgi:hypothetical protein